MLQTVSGGNEVLFEMRTSRQRAHILLRPTVSTSCLCHPQEETCNARGRVAKCSRIVALLQFRHAFFLYIHFQGWLLASCQLCIHSTESSFPTLPVVSCNHSHRAARLVTVRARTYFLRNTQRNVISPARRSLLPRCDAMTVAPCAAQIDP